MVGAVVTFLTSPGQEDARSLAMAKEAAEEAAPKSEFWPT